MKATLFAVVLAVVVGSSGVGVPAHATGSHDNGQHYREERRFHTYLRR